MNTTVFYTLKQLVLKNFKILLRAKSSALIVIGGPLLIIFIAGLAFDNTNLYTVNIGTFAENYNSLSSSFVERLTSRFQVTRFPTQDSCVSAIKSGETHACVVFSSDFTIGKNNSNELTFFVDYSKINLVWAVVSTMTEQVSSRSLEISKNLTGILLHAIDVSEKEVAARKSSMISLTTFNDESTRKLANSIASLGEMELTINPDEFGVSNLSSSKTKVKHWVDNALSIAEKSLQEGRSAVGNVGDIVAGSSLDDAKKEAVGSFIKDSKDDLNALAEQLDSTKVLASQEFASLDAVVSQAVGKLTQTRAKLDSAEIARNMTVAELGAVRDLMDKSLANILNVQNSLNTIERVISAIEITDSQSIVEPVVTTIKPVVAEKSYLNYIFPSMMVLAVMFTALLLAPTLIFLERNSPAYVRNFMSPVKDWVFIASIGVTCLVVVGLQVFLMLLISAALFSSSIFLALPQTLISLAVISCVFVSVGIAVGYLFSSEETAALASVSLGTLFLLLSNTLVPLESMPFWLMKLASFNPFVIGSSLLRKTLLYRVSVGSLWTDVVLLVAYAVLISFIAFIFYKNTKTSLLKKYLPMLHRQKTTTSPKSF